jgi:ribosome-binding protein aMBF1 (putative translation factor)
MGRRVLDDMELRMERDPELRAEYERQKPRYDALRALIDARLRAKLTQAELAARMGVSQSVVARLEGAGSSPRIDTLAAAATAMGCELEVKFKKRRRPAA